MIPGRWKDVREPNESELQQTTVLSLPISEASAKIRTGPPLDDEKDYKLGIWAGVVPLGLSAAPAIPDLRLRPDLATPAYATNYRRGPQ
jgi:hypothetical protein